MVQIVRLDFEGQVDVEINPDVDICDPEAWAKAILAAWETMDGEKIAEAAKLTEHTILDSAARTGREGGQ